MFGKQNTGTHSALILQQKDKIQQYHVPSEFWIIAYFFMKIKKQTYEKNNVKSAQKSGGLSDHHFSKSGGPAENPVASGHRTTVNFHPCPILNLSCLCSK